MAFYNVIIGIVIGIIVSILIVGVLCIMLISGESERQKYKERKKKTSKK